MTKEESETLSRTAPCPRSQSQEMADPLFFVFFWGGGLLILLTTSSTHRGELELWRMLNKALAVRTQLSFLPS